MSTLFASLPPSQSPVIHTWQANTLCTHTLLRTLPYSLILTAIPRGLKKAGCASCHPTNNIKTLTTLMARNTNNLYTNKRSTNNRIHWFWYVVSKTLLRNDFLHIWTTVPNTEESTIPLKDQPIIQNQDSLLSKSRDDRVGNKRSRMNLVSRSESCPRFVCLPIIHIDLCDFNVVTELEDTSFTQFMHRRTKTQLHTATQMCIKHCLVENTFLLQKKTHCCKAIDRAVKNAATINQNFNPINPIWNEALTEAALGIFVKRHHGRHLESMSYRKFIVMRGLLVDLTTMHSISLAQFSTGIYICPFHSKDNKNVL